MKLQINNMNFFFKKSFKYMQISFFAALLLNLFSCTLDGFFNNQKGTTPQPQVGTDTIAAPPAEPVDTLNVEKLSKTRIDSNSRVIYLTFDDGPLAPTPFLTAIIHEKQNFINLFASDKFVTSTKSKRIVFFFASRSDRSRHSIQLHHC